MRTLGRGSGLPRQLAIFGAIGVASTLAYLGLFALLRVTLPALAANALALFATTLANTALNRRLTFGIRGREDLARHHAAGLAVFGAALALTSGSLWLLGAVAPAAGRAVELGALVGSNAAATLLRFIILRMVVAGPATRRLPLILPGATRHEGGKPSFERTIR